MTPKFHSCIVGCFRLTLVAALVQIATPESALAVELVLNLGPAPEGTGGYHVHYTDVLGPSWTGDFAAEGPSPIDFPIESLDAQAPELSVNFPTCHEVHVGLARYDIEEKEDPMTYEVGGIVLVAPKAVAVGPSGPGALRVRWAGLDEKDSGAVAGFRVYYDTDGQEPFEGTGADQGDSPIEVGGDATSLELTGLTVGETVNVVVEAYCPSDSNVMAADPVGAEVSGEIESGCNNGKIEPELYETCDPIETCPTECEDDGDACTVGTYSGSADACTAKCTQEVITACTNGDGCCPAVCDSSSDDDCSTECGDGDVNEDEGETCDPPGSCPTTCDDGDACTLDAMTGSSENCNVKCNKYAVTSCVNGDGCCPAGCTSDSDDDCTPSTSDPDGTDTADSSAGNSNSLDGGGCSVASHAGPAWLLGLALLGLALIRRRR